ncbi:hypothetical protein Cme02nite_10380 [Catellatospora methionotrophica]|uniref:Uncharacterized protein n=1 Tax=Catellatospora methionotrophica TaxID=121620 RepID=A0A8J3PCR7_9ACTN|nr:hypothetical protein [Catellatospora methionotrophica]GIG12706.1 hypothetical protein Cme02nite_10380 [Catellatospora methionotrophica]
MTALERRYRRLMLWYPRSYRDSRGDEIVSTLLDLAPPGQRWPTAVEAADLIEGGLRRRLGVATVDGLDEGLRRAAPVALALLGGAAAFLWWRVEPLGPPTLGPAAYAAWLLACAVALLAPARWTRPALATALAVTMTLPAVAPLTPYARPPVWVLMTFSVFGVIALAGTGPWSRDLERRAAPALGAIAVACGAHLVAQAWPDPLVGYYQPAFAQLGLVVAAAVGALAALALTAPRHDAPPRSQLWATLLIALPGAWLGPFDTDTWRATTALPPFGRLAQVLLGTTLVLLTMARLRTHRPRRTPANADPSGASATAPGPQARGVAAAMLAGCAVGLLGFVAGIGAVTGHAVATVLVCGVAAALLGTSRAGRGTGQRTRAPGSGLVARVREAGLAAVATLAGAYAVGVYSNDWTFGGWTELTRTAGLAVSLAVVPLAFAAYTAYRSARQVPVVAAGLLCAGWLGWLMLPELPAWGPVLPVLAAAGLVRAALSIPAWRGRTGP